MKTCFVLVGKSAYRMGSEHVPATAARGCGQVRCERSVALFGVIAESKKKAGEGFVRRKKGKGADVEPPIAAAICSARGCGVKRLATFP
jgi:hypothetical protein